MYVYVLKRPVRVVRGSLEHTKMASLANKDEAEKCRDMAKRFLERGEREKAVRFFEKSLKLYPLPGVETMRDLAKVPYFFDTIMIHEYLLIFVKDCAYKEKVLMNLTGCHNNFLEKVIYERESLYVYKSQGSQISFIIITCILSTPLNIDPWYIYPNMRKKITKLSFFKERFGGGYIVHKTERITHSDHSLPCFQGTIRVFSIPYPPLPPSPSYKRLPCGSNLTTVWPRRGIVGTIIEIIFECIFGTDSTELRVVFCQRQWPHAQQR